PPTVNDASFTTESNTPIDVPLSGSDLDGDSLIFVVVSGPAHGTLSGSTPNLTYTPATGFSGADSFTFKANDGKADSPPGSVSLKVLPPAPPAAPGGLTASAISRTQINLAWSDHSRTEYGFQIVLPHHN